MLAMVCAVALAQTPMYVKPFSPSGPRIEVAMASGGKFTITTDPVHSPKTVAHVLDLVKRKFYDNQRVHRVEYWVTQWGDPLSKTAPMDDPKMGEGDSGHRLPFEMSDVDFTRGVVGIASDGLQNGGDSQIFVIKKDRMYLYHSYAVLGKVTRGMAVVDAIKKGDRILRMTTAPAQRANTFVGVPYEWMGSERARLQERYYKAGGRLRERPSDARLKEEFAKAANAYADAIIDSSIAPREKYPIALRMYREVLVVDRNNKSAKTMVKMIEDTYRAMGRPIPK